MSKVPPAHAVLEGAYRCFCRNGYRHTTISDIVDEAQLSRPTVYKYAGSKDEAFGKVVQALLERASAAATRAASAADTPHEKVLAVLEVKLELAIRLWQDSPAHAYELLSTASTQLPELVAGYVDGLSDLIASALAEVVPDTARQATSVLLTFTRGLEDDLRDVDAARRELAMGVHMITTGALSRAESLPA